MNIILIPAYNAVHTIAEVVFKAREYGEVIVYDDGSTDDTAYVARHCGATVLREEANHGKGYALRRLFRYALVPPVEDKIFITLDADMQHDPHEIPQLIQPILNGEAQATLGTRRNTSVIRSLGNRLLDYFTDTEHRETQCGFRAYTPEALAAISISTDGFGVDSEIISCMEEMETIEVPVTTKYDSYSHTKNVLTHFSEVLHYLCLRSPLLNLGALGGISFIAGLIQVIQVILIWNQRLELALGTFISGTTLLLLGALTFFVGLILHVIKAEKY